MAHYRTKQLGLFLYMGKKKKDEHSQRKTLIFPIKNEIMNTGTFCHNCLYSTLDVQIYAMVDPSKM